jgi:hypothetical protein
MRKHIENISIDPFCPEEPPITTAGAANASGTWWNSQISATNKGREYTIQMGTFDKEVFDKVSKVLAQIMDEEYARRHY